MTKHIPRIITPRIILQSKVPILAFVILLCLFFRRLFLMIDLLIVTNCSIIKSHAFPSLHPMQGPICSCLLPCILS